MTQPEFIPPAKPIIGEEEADALLSHCPSNDLDTPATKDFVRAEIAQLEARMN